MRSQSLLFTKLVKETMRQSPPHVPTSADCAAAIAAMREGDSSSVTIVNEHQRPVGILTEQDVARRIAFNMPGNTPAATVMTTPALTISEDELLFHAIAVMRRRNIRHMPVVDGDTGVLTGVLRLKDALFSTDETLMNQIDILTRDNDIEGFKAIKKAQVDLAAQLIDDCIPVPEILALLTQINSDIYHRVVDCTIEYMKKMGRGGPPVEFSAIVMGSGGRGENFIFPDQDNGLILADYPDDQHTEIDAWFADFSDSMTQTLDQVGFPLCNGYVMATNPLWRKTESQWKNQIEIWAKKRTTTALRLCDILFDFRSVWGENGFAVNIRRHITEIVGKNVSFLRDMEEEDKDAGVALGFFDRFITAKDDEEHKGMVNLKQSGSLPLIEAVRIISLREGFDVLSTLGRIDKLFEAGYLDRHEHDYLSGAYHHIVDQIQRSQIADFRKGGKVSYYIYPDSLTKRETDILKDSFKAIRSFRSRVRGEFTGDIF